MTTPALRRAGPEDARRLALLGAATFLATFAHDHPGDGLIAHVEASHCAEWYGRILSEGGGAAWLLETALGAPVGYALLTPPAIACPTDEGDLELKRIYLLAPWQGGGNGGRLMDAVETEARLRGAGRLFLCVYPQNVTAKRFYATRGFADTGHRQSFFVGDTAFDDEIWAKPL